MRRAGSHQHGVQLPEGQRKADQRLHQYDIQGLHHQLPGSPGHRYDGYARASDAHRAVLHRPRKACPQFHGGPRRDQHQRHDNQGGRACQRSAGLPRQRREEGTAPDHFRRRPGDGAFGSDRMFQFDFLQQR